MKISTKGRYALRLLLDLAEHQADGYVALRDIAKRQNISKKYLEQIVPILNRSDILTTNRGYQGGYRLVREPEGITVGEVLRALEGGLNLVDCLLEEDSCGKSCACPSRIVWLKIRDGLNRIVDGITLQDMIDEYACQMAQGEEE